MTKHNLKSLGIMEYIASGVIELNDKRFRWLVIPRLGRVVQDILEESGGVFSRPCVILLALQLVCKIRSLIHLHLFRCAEIPDLVEPDFVSPASLFDLVLAE